MRTRRANFKVIKMHENKVIGVRVELTTHTSITGKVTYAVLVRNMNTGRHYRLFVYDGIQKAFIKYKAAVA